MQYFKVCLRYFFSYIAWSGEFELVPGGEGGERETPMQKYQRLNCEVRELLDDIHVLSQEKTKDDKGEVNTCGLIKSHEFFEPFFIERNYSLNN